MLRASSPVAFVATTKPQQALAFYRDCLGLRFVADSPFALVFDLNGTPLRITKLQRHDPAPHTVLGWQVSDIQAAVRVLASRGVSFERYPAFHQNELGIWTSPDGAQVAWFKDPDGNTLSLTQS